jgi:hypothetical protein
MLFNRKCKSRKSRIFTGSVGRGRHVGVRHSTSSGACAPGRPLIQVALPAHGRPWPGAAVVARMDNSGSPKPGPNDRDGDTPPPPGGRGGHADTRPACPRPQEGRWDPSTGPRNNRHRYKRKPVTDGHADRPRPYRGAGGGRQHHPGARYASIKHAFV